MDAILAPLATGKAWYGLNTAQPVVYPYIVYQRVSSSPNVSLGGPSALQNTRVQIDIYSQRVAEAAAIESQLEATLACQMLQNPLAGTQRWFNPDDLQVYEARPDVKAVVHSHAESVVPFSISETPLVPVCHSGSEIGEHQLVKQLIANMVKGTEIGRLLVFQAGWLKNRGLRNTRETSLAKWHATEHSVQAALDAIQVHGAMGYTYEDLPSGLQIIGRPWSEPLLIAIAYAYEQATHHRKAPATVPPLS